MKARKKDIITMGRLKKRPEFLSVQGSGRKWTAKGLMLQVRARDDGDDTIRFGLTVTKRVSASAVVRNRIRRRLYVTACEILPACAASGADYVLVGRTETLTRSSDDLRRDLQWCLEKLGLKRL